jgi:hypothetical protein
MEAAVLVWRPLQPVLGASTSLDVAESRKVFVRSAGRLVLLASTPSAVEGRREERVLRAHQCALQGNT